MTTHQRNFPSIDPVKVERLAETAVKVGLRLRAGQDLFMTAPVAALPLARRIAAEAYKAGAGLVTPILSDEEIALARFRFAPDASFDRAPGWLYEGVAKAFDANTARLAIVGEDPMLLSNEDPAKVARANKANSMPTSQRSRRSPASTSTGTSSRIRRRRGRSGSFRETRRRSPSASWRKRSSRRLASTMTIRSPPGMRTTPVSANGRNG